MPEPILKPLIRYNVGQYAGRHLNGLAKRDGKIHFVTAFAEANTPGGWRENKRDGGLIDVQTNEVIMRGRRRRRTPDAEGRQRW